MSYVAINKDMIIAAAKACINQIENSRKPHEENYQKRIQAYDLMPRWKKFFSSDPRNDLWGDFDRFGFSAQYNFMRDILVLAELSDSTELNISVKDMRFFKTWLNS